MGSLRIRSTSAIAMLVGVLVVMTALVGPADALTARKLTLKASPTSAYGGTVVTFSGNSSSLASGQPILLQRLVGTSWVKVTSGFTARGGSYALKSTLTSTAGQYSFRTWATATSTLASAASPTVKVTSLGVNPDAPVIVTTELHDADKGVAYTETLKKTGDPGTWSISAGTLPAGITLDGSTGVLSGTPTAGGTSSFTVKFTETTSGLADTQALTLLVTPPPTITTTALPNATRAVAYSTTLTKSGKAGTWSVPANSLPAGLSLNSSTGTISGVPSVVGTYGVYPTFTETSTGRTASKALALTINGQPLAITTSSLPNGTQGSPYSVTLTQNGGAGTWSSLALPDGLALNATTGVLSGTPTVAGDYPIYLAFTESATGTVATKSLALHLDAGPPPAGGPTITTTALPNGAKDQPYSTTLTKTGGPGTWVKTAGVLPPGVALNPSTGVLSGTPTAIGSFGFTIKFTETGTGLYATKDLAIYVTAGPTITTEALPDAHVGQPYSVTLTKTGAAGTWSSLELPAGLSLDAATGVISGTPTTGGDYGVYVGYTETASGLYATKSFALHVLAPLVTTTSVPDGTTGTAYSQQLTKTGLAGTWSLTKGTLPPGVTLSSSGLLSGTPTTSGDWGFTVTFTETSTGASDNQVLLLHVSDPGSPVISSPNQLPDAQVGTPYSTTLAATPTGGTWSIIYGSLPVGLTLNPTTGQISGTPQFAENAIFVAKYTKGATSNTKAFGLNAAPAPTP